MLLGTIAPAKQRNFENHSVDSENFNDELYLQELANYLSVAGLETSYVHWQTLPQIFSSKNTKISVI